MNKITVIFFILLSGRTIADDFYYVGAMLENDLNNFVGEIGMGETSPAPDYFGQISLMYFGHEGEVYEGFNFSMSKSVSFYNFTTYAGLGAFIGKREECEKIRNSPEEECNTYFTAGMYPEIGANWYFRNFFLGAYVRYYTTFDAGNNKYNMIGFRIGQSI